jgi:hypothetical protein
MRNLRHIFPLSGDKNVPLEQLISGDNVSHSHLHDVLCGGEGGELGVMNGEGSDLCLSVRPPVIVYLQS